MAMPKEIEKRISEDYYQRSMKLEDLEKKYSLRSKSLKDILRRNQPVTEGES